MPRNPIKKAVLLVAGLGTRFLPLSKVFSKELWPLLNRPIIDYIIDEIKRSGIKEIVFVISPENKALRDYFRRNRKAEKILKERGKKEILRDFQKHQRSFKGLSLSFVCQKEPLGLGHAILQAKSKVGKEPFIVCYNDDVIISDTPCLSQLIKVFKEYGKAVVAIKRVPKERVGLYGSLKVKKVGPRLYQIKGIIEKPKLGQAYSNLVLDGRYLLTADVFNYLGKPESFFQGEIILANALEEMIKAGIIVYGYEFEGKWLECGTVQTWLKSNLFLAKRHPDFKNFK
ncbi:MAG: sugar phosphate nucleotidyltransferase [bacterium]|nr:sugar phosphate nucleotidyltransferase [bacterium]